MQLSKSFLIFCFLVSIKFVHPLPKSRIQISSKRNERTHEPRGQRSHNSSFQINSRAIEPQGDEDEVRFYIFINSDEKMKRIRMDSPDSLQRLENFVFGNPVVILIHGFLGNCRGDNFPGLLVQAYFEQEQNKNILCTDWPDLAFSGKTLSLASSISAYQKSITNGFSVGKRLAEFIRFLTQAEAIQSLKDVHIIGYSMGAHVAAAASTALQEQFSEKIGRITGLDPAGPVYRYLPAEKHLDPLDAQFVDVYHTNSGKLGIKDPLGHTDFYINGGDFQPECRNTGIPKIDKVEPLTGICSHQMVPYYYAESILNRALVRACNASEWKLRQEEDLCDAMVPFGEQSSLGLFGEYYVAIGAKISNRIWLPDISFQ